MTVHMTNLVVRIASSPTFDLAELELSALPFTRFRPISSSDLKNLVDESEKTSRLFLKSISEHQLYNIAYPPTATRISTNKTPRLITQVTRYNPRPLPLRDNHSPTAPIFEPYAHNCGLALNDLFSRIFNPNYV